MTTTEKALVTFICVLLLALVAENVIIVYDVLVRSPATIEACPKP